MSESASDFEMVQVQSIGELKRGDIIRHHLNGDSYVVDRPAQDGGDCAVAIRTYHVQNPREWLVRRRKAPASIGDSPSTESVKGA